MDFDLIVVGLGPGGEEVAGKLAEAGRAVLGVDERLLGGECPYFGCIPSKMVLRAADALAESRRIGQLAGTASDTPDFGIVARRIREEATDDWDDRVAVERFEGQGASFIRATGRLAGRDEDGRLLVEVAGETHRAKDVVIATGTRPSIPPIDGLDALEVGVDGPVWTNREILKARQAPASMVVIGGGVISCELAQGMARFGTRVTVIEGGERLMTREEPEAGEVLADVFAREGIAVELGRSVSTVGRDHDGVTVTLSDGSTVSGEKLLVAAGRTPNLDDVGLDTIGLDPSARVLDVDEHMSVLGGDGSPVPGLHAVGDVTGKGPFTHVSVWQARVLEAHLLGARRAVRRVRRAGVGDVHRSGGRPRRQDRAAGARRRTERPRRACNRSRPTPAAGSTARATTAWSSSSRTPTAACSSARPSSARTAAS